MADKNVVLELTQITQAYDQQLVVKDLSLTLKSGEIGCLLGARLWQVEIRNRGEIATIGWNMSRHTAGFQSG